MSGNGLSKNVLWFYLEGTLRLGFKIPNTYKCLYIYIHIYIYLASWLAIQHTHMYTQIVGGLKYKLNLLYILCPVRRVTHCHKHTVCQNSAHN